MLILGLETSGFGGAVALQVHGHTFSREIPSELRSAQGLAPVIRDVLREAAITPRELELVAVINGPGSFTGLRVGVMTAKTLAYALRTPCLGMNTLDVIAAQADIDPTGRLWAIFDAQRQQVFAAAYERQAGVFSCVRPTAIEDNEAWLLELRPGDVVTGPGLVALERKVLARPGVAIASRESWFPQAATVAQLAVTEFISGRRDDPWKLVPQYFRLSAAEEKAK